ncbi:MAG: hypothetical protein C0467_30560 [Planctomycetaceae bacterium]|nr:hypothetical protein [Planctomycetaceae bacterium]
MNSVPPSELGHTQGLLDAITTAADGCDPYTWAADVASTVSACRPRHLREKLAERAFEFLEHAFHTYDRSRPLEPWARSVLRRRLIDLYRHGRRTAGLTDHHRDPGRQAVSLNEWQTVFETIRKAVTVAHFYPLTAEGPDHYAVFSFDLRVRRGTRFSTAPQHTPERSSATRTRRPISSPRPGCPTECWGFYSLPTRLTIIRCSATRLPYRFGGNGRMVLLRAWTSLRGWATRRAASSNCLTPRETAGNR